MDDNRNFGFSSGSNFYPSSAHSAHIGSKRGRDPSDDLALQLGQLPPPKLPSNNYSMPNQCNGLPSNNNNDVKTRMSDIDSKGEVEFTRVVHIRNIPTGATDMEVIQLAMPFGKVTNILMLKNKNQAFLELSQVSEAVSIVDFFKTGQAQAMINGRPVFVQHSQHKELHTNAYSAAQTQATLQALSGGADDGSGIRGCGVDGRAIGQGDDRGGNSKTGNPPSPVLRVLVENMIYPITMETLLLIFKKYGPIQKIVTFTKNNTFQALVQFRNNEEAEAAKVNLHGQNIYNGCCNLKVDFSKMTGLAVRYNNDKSHDFTNPNLPAGFDNGDAAKIKAHGTASNAPGILAANPYSVPPPSVSPPMNGGFGSGRSGSVKEEFAFNRPPPAPSPQLNPQLTALLQTLAGPLAALTAANPQQAALLASLTVGGLGSNTPFGSSSPIMNRIPGMTAPMALPSGMVPTSLPGVGVVIHVSGMPDGPVTPDDLFTLFGVYGDVVRVKILYKQKENALIQMADAAQAVQAVHFLDGIKLYGKAIQVIHSKHTTVQLPKEGTPDGGLTKDYSGSSLHRFKKPGSKNFSNVFAPSATLHLSNIHHSANEEQITDAFKEHANVVAFKFFPKDNRMALIQLESIEASVIALIKMHNYQMADKAHLRVSFSKSNIKI